ncbi:glycosyltransferase family 4 protein [Verrucomicrobia bacterium]|nr:glycosyltransferase family 4 protein [Verrucomicrobiota bacterium]
MAGVFISKTLKVPLVVDIVDLWPESLSAAGFVTNKSLLHAIGIAERWLYHHCTALSVVTKGYKSCLVKLGVESSRINIINHWVPNTYRHLGRNLPSLPSGDEEFWILYAGTMGPAQGLETILDAASRLRDHPRVRWLMVGSGLHEAKLRAYAEKLGLKNIKFTGRIPQKEIQKLIPKVGACVVHLRSTNLSVVSIPSKTYTYLAMGRPILMALEGEAAELVKKHKCGIAVAPEDPDAIAGAAVSLAEMSSDELIKISQAALKAFDESYSSTIGVKRMAKLLDKYASKSSENTT